MQQTISDQVTLVNKLIESSDWDYLSLAALQPIIEIFQALEKHKAEDAATYLLQIYKWLDPNSKQRVILLAIACYRLRSLKKFSNEKVFLSNIPGNELPWQCMEFGRVWLQLKKSDRSDFKMIALWNLFDQGGLSLSKSQKNTRNYTPMISSLCFINCLYSLYDCQSKQDAKSIIQSMFKVTNMKSVEKQIMQFHTKTMVKIILSDKDSELAKDLVKNLIQQDPEKIPEFFKELELEIAKLEEKGKQQDLQLAQLEQENRKLKSDNEAKDSMIAQSFGMIEGKDRLIDELLNIQVDVSPQNGFMAGASQNGFMAGASQNGFMAVPTQNGFIAAPHAHYTQTLLNQQDEPPRIVTVGELGRFSGHRLFDQQDAFGEWRKSVSGL